MAKFCPLFSSSGGNSIYIGAGNNGILLDVGMSAKQIEIVFTITKNITATTGEKTAYIRIMQPNGEVLTKSANKTFVYENRKIEFSISRKFEYTGESYDLTLYWDIEETLKEGEYNAYIFVDGNMIGSGKATFEQ